MAADTATVHSRKNPWEPGTSHANGHAADITLPSLSSNVHEEDGDEHAPATIFAHTFALTVTLTISSAFTSYLALSPAGCPHWRLPFFLAALSLFHLLEYYTTALYNPRVASTSAFLLNNGKAYNIAHCLAFLECALHLLRPGLPLAPQTASLGSSWWWVSVGFALVLGGQIVRTMAMATAGSNFNHIVQSHRKTDHVLVTGGVYSWLRHPSYFGFFWWGLGTQIVLGNVVCLVGYAVVLWRFFRKRIQNEEKFLIEFFGDEYVQYRQRTRVGIPFLGK